LCAGGISYTSFERRRSLRYAIVLVLLNFPLKWTGRDSPVTSPPCSPDFSTPLGDFFFWGYLKNAVYIPLLPTTVRELVGRI